MSNSPDYGINWARGTSQLKKELTCYRHNHPPVKGGLGKAEHFKNAWMLLYPHLVPSYNSWTENIIQALCHEDRVGGGVASILGGSGCGKSHTCGYWLYLDFLADPENTVSVVATTTLDDLEQRIWKYIANAYDEATVQVGKMKKSKPKVIQMGDGKIQTMALDDDPEGERLKGFHPRRLRIFIDEATSISGAVLTNWENWISAQKSFLLAGMSNFRGFDNLCAAITEPIGGWNSVEYTEAETWKTKLGTAVLLDLTRSPVYRRPELGKPGMPLAFLRSKDSVDDAMQKLGHNHPRVFQYIRSIPQFDDSIKTVLNRKLIHKGNVDRKPHWAGWGQEKLVALDPAFVTDGDEAILMRGTLGYELSGKKILKFEEVISIPIDSTIKEPTEYQLLNYVVKYCEKHGVPPENFVTDACGSGRGLGSIFQHDWSDKIKLILPSHGAGNEIVDFEFNKRAKDIYDRFVTRLWFQMREYVEFGHVVGLDEDSIRQFCSRLYDDTKVKISLEKKPEYKRRIYGDDSVNGSPDRADCATYMLELAKDFDFQVTKEIGVHIGRAVTDYKTKVQQHVELWAAGKLPEQQADHRRAEEPLGYDFLSDFMGEGTSDSEL